MSHRTEVAETGLTAYEAEQVRQIGAWKSEPPHPLSELWKMIALPAARAVEKVLPDAAVRSAIERSYDASELLAGREDIQRQAGVKDLTELRNEPLEICEGLAKRVGLAAQTLATAEGAATGAGGVLTTLIDVPLLFVLALRTVLRIGHCYGYPLDQPKDRPFVLGLLIAATSGSLEIRRQRLSRLRELEDLVLEEAQVEILTEEVLAFLFQLEVFEGVPGIGAISGALLNLMFMHRVDITARRVFQERWLRDNGKIREIVPSEAPARHLATGWSGALGRAAYSVCYGIGFGVALPAAIAAALFRPLDNAVTRGFRDGAAAATAAAEQALNRTRAATERSITTRALPASPAPA
jgi:hypothetical protein